MRVPTEHECKGNGAGAGDVALGALAVGLNAAEGIARSFGLSRQQDMPDADAGADLEYDAVDEDDADCEEEKEAWELPAEALMSATDQLALSLMEAQVGDSSLVPPCVSCGKLQTDFYSCRTTPGHAADADKPMLALKGVLAALSSHAN